MVKPQGSLHNQAVLSPVGMEVYLLQVLVGNGDEAVVVENLLGVREQQVREGFIQFIGILEVTVILFYVETLLIYLYKVCFYYSIPLPKIKFTITRAHSEIAYKNSGRATRGYQLKYFIHK